MRRRRIPFWVGIALLAAACSGGGEADGTLSDAIPDAVVTTTSSTSQPSTTVATTTSLVVDERTEVDAAWSEYLEAWATARGSDPLDVTGLEAVAWSPLVARVRTDIAAERVNPAGGPGWIVSTEYETSALEINVDGESATWEGCTAIREVGEPIDSDAIGVEPFEQVLIDRELISFERADSGWFVTSIETVSDHCVPADLDDATAAEIVAAYEEYWDRRDEFLDPPDPSGPAIDQVSAGSANEFLRGLAEQMLDEGAALRGRPETHPELSEFGLGTAVIVDCQALPDDWGAFDLASGDPRPDILDVVPGQRDARQTFLVMEEGRWKVALLRGSTNVECEFGQLTSE